MPYCPKCQAEYKEGTTMCSDCEEKLVDKLPPPEDEGLDAEIKTVLLCQTNDIMSAEILEQALKDYNIPHIVRSSTGAYSGIGSISQVMKGVRIYVSETAKEKAIEIAQTIIPDFELPDESR
jgi:hypothetical protein